MDSCCCWGGCSGGCWGSCSGLGWCSGGCYSSGCGCTQTIVCQLVCNPNQCLGTQTCLSQCGIACSPACNPNDCFSCSAPAMGQNVGFNCCGDIPLCHPGATSQTEPYTSPLSCGTSDPAPFAGGSDCLPGCLPPCSRADSSVMCSMPRTSAGHGGSGGGSARSATGGGGSAGSGASMGGQPKQSCSKAKNAVTCNKLGTAIAALSNRLGQLTRSGVTAAAAAPGAVTPMYFGIIIAVVGTMLLFLAFGKEN